MVHARHAGAGGIALVLAAADLEVSEARGVPLTEELLALAAPAKGIAAIVTSRPTSVPAVVFQHPTQDEALR